MGCYTIVVSLCGKLTYVFLYATMDFGVLAFFLVYEII
jgi:hypothetical protein